MTQRCTERYWWSVRFWHWDAIFSASLSPSLYLRSSPRLPPPAHLSFFIIHSHSSVEWFQVLNLLSPNASVSRLWASFHMNPLHASLLYHTSFTMYCLCCVIKYSQYRCTFKLSLEWELWHERNIMCLRALRLETFHISCHIKQCLYIQPQKCHLWELLSSESGTAFLTLACEKGFWECIV